MPMAASPWGSLQISTPEALRQLGRKGHTCCQCSFPWRGPWWGSLSWVSFTRPLGAILGRGCGGQRLPLQSDGQGVAHCLSPSRAGRVVRLLEALRL